MPNSQDNAATTNKFNQLTQFKRYMQNEFKQHCRDTYGQAVFADFIFPYYSDLLECIEYHIEDLGEQSIQDEELMEGLLPEEIDPTD